MRHSVSRPLLILAAVGVLTTLSATGCGNILVAKPVAQGCGWVRSAETTSVSGTASAASNTVVLIDTSASFWPPKGTSQNLPADPVRIAVSKLVSGYVLSGTRLISVGTFNGSSATVSWRISDAPLPVPTGADSAIRGQQRNANQCLTSVVRSLVQTPPAIGGTDVMGALSAAGAALGATPAARSHVLVATDGLSNTGCMNLSQILAQGQTAADVVSSCAAQDGLKRLRGADVTLAGIGFDALKTPMTTAQQAWLENYWRDICAGLKVASSSSCIAVQGSSSVRGSSVSRPSDPTISFPTVATRTVIPAPLLFAFNSAKLSPTAQSYLDILVQQIKATGRPVTTVIGHTDRVGTAAYNLGLSQRRAEAVRAYLIAQGFKGIKAIGVGFSQPACPDESVPECMAKDRRVEIILGGRK